MHSTVLVWQQMCVTQAISYINRSVPFEGEDQLFSLQTLKLCSSNLLLDIQVLVRWSEAHHKVRHFCNLYNEREKGMLVKKEPSNNDT